MRRPVENAETERLFQLLQARTQGRLRHKTKLRRPREMPRFRQHREVVKLLEREGGAGKGGHGPSVDVVVLDKFK